MFISFIRVLGETNDAAIDFRQGCQNKNYTDCCELTRAIDTVTIDLLEDVCLPLTLPETVQARFCL